MNIVVNGRNVEVTPALKQYAEDKIGKFDRYMANITEAVVTLSIQKHRHKTEVLLKANGAMIQAVGVTEELYSSIDEVVEKLDKQIKKHKGKMTAHRKSDTKAKEAAPPVEKPVAEPGRAIIRRRADAKPMPPEEAAMQMELSGKEFLVFPNSSTGVINVIYRMNDGNFGLIEP